MVMIIIIRYQNELYLLQPVIPFSSLSAGPRSTGWAGSLTCVELFKAEVSATDDVGGKLHLSTILLAVSPAHLTPTGVLPNENVFVVFSNLQRPAIKFGFSRQIFVTAPHVIKLRGNPSSEGRPDTFGQTDGQVEVNGPFRKICERVRKPWAIPVFLNLYETAAR